MNDQKAQPSTSPIREEYKRLQEVESIVTDIWQSEVQAYEQDNGSTDVIAAAASNEAALDTTAASSHHGGHRNHPNSQGTVTDPLVFPYHHSLYALLDCYDSIKQEEDDVGTSNIKEEAIIISPSQAPNPFTRNGYRRSKFTPRLDPNGFRIEELGFLEGHLPNSAWAIRESLMPCQRKMEFLRFRTDQEKGDRSSSLEEERIRAQEAVGLPNGEEADLASSRPRFWKLLTSATNGPNSNLSLENVSLGPIDVELDDDFVDKDMPIASNARDFSFLTWWEHEVVSNPNRTTTEGSSHSVSPKETSMEYFLANSPEEASMVLLRVLKHSMSDLQRDFKLARAVLLLIADLYLMDGDNSESSMGLEILRRMLVIISLEYIHCNGSCHEAYFAIGGLEHFAQAAHEHDDDEFSHNIEEHESIDLEETTNEDNEEWDVHNNTALNDSQLAESPTHYCQDVSSFLFSLIH